MNDPARIRRLRTEALVAGGATGVGFAALATGPAAFLWITVFVGLIPPVLDRPARLPALVVGGQLAAGAVLLGLDGLVRWAMLPMLLALLWTVDRVARLERGGGPVPRTTVAEASDSPRPILLGGAVFAVVLAIGEPPPLPGPGAFLLVAGAAIVLVWSLLREGPAASSRVESAPPEAAP